MKLLVAIVRPERLEAVQTALGEVGVFRLTVMDVLGLPEPAPGAAAPSPPAALPASRLTPLVRLEIALDEAFVEPAATAIVRAARTGGGRPGDGKLFVLPLEEVVRIRTGERGTEAL